VTPRAGAGVHRVWTAHLQAPYPFVPEGVLDGRGVYIGREVLGGAFCYHPWELYAQGVLTNPNVLVAGQVGRGKSSFIKTYLWRQQTFGRHAWFVDPKGEYGPLAAACGGEPVRIGPGLPVRLNPLDTGACFAQRVRYAWPAGTGWPHTTFTTAGPCLRAVPRRRRSAGCRSPAP
jgi:hypothetical protein